MKKLYRFYWDCGRQGDLEGIFIREEKDVKNIIGTSVNFGEVLGKHSEVCGDIEEGEITELDVSENTVNELESVIGSTVSGYNPFDYVTNYCEECECEYRSGECDFYVDEEKDILVCEYCIDENNMSKYTKQ